MKKAIAISAIVITTLVSSGDIMAKDASKEENIGAASGAVIGAALGGPVGFFIGTALGAILGTEVEKAGQVDELQMQLNHASTQERQLKDQVSRLQQEVQLVQNTSSNLEGSEMLQMDVLFHTGSHALDDMDQDRLKRLSAFLLKHPDLNVNLEGFADPRGKKEKNQLLSLERVNQVKDHLISKGISADRIEVSAFGESLSAAPKNDLDAYALERRVSIRFNIDNFSTDNQDVAQQ